MSEFEGQYRLLDSKFQEQEQFEAKVEELINDWQNDLVEAYNNNYWLTFVDGK